MLYQTPCTFPSIRFGFSVTWLRAFRNLQMNAHSLFLGSIDEEENGSCLKNAVQGIAAHLANS